MSTPEQLFAQLVATQPTRPFVTYYDEASGERTELSVRSLANWVAKTHFLLLDELGLGVGDTAAIALPPHWLSVPVLLGCLSAGLALQPGGDGDVAFVTADSVGAATGADVYAVGSGLTAAVGFRDAPPAGTADYVAAVRPQADAWASVRMPGSVDDPCLPGLTRGEAIERAGGLADGARVLTTRDWATPQDWIDTLFAALAAQGSLVYVRNCADAAVLDRRTEQERATVRI